MLGPSKKPRPYQLCEQVSSRVLIFKLIPHLPGHDRILRSCIETGSFSLYNSLLYKSGVVSCSQHTTVEHYTCMKAPRLREVATSSESSRPLPNMRPSSSAHTIPRLRDMHIKCWQGAHMFQAPSLCPLCPFKKPQTPQRLLFHVVKIVVINECILPCL